MSEKFSIDEVTKAFDKVHGLKSKIIELMNKLKKEYSGMPHSEEYAGDLSRAAFRFNKVFDPLTQFLNNVAFTELRLTTLENDINNAWQEYEQTISDPGKLTLVIPGKYLVSNIKKLPEGAVLHDKDSIFANFFKPEKEEEKEENYLVVELKHETFGTSEMTILDNYRDKAEPFIERFFRTAIPEEIQKYFNENKNKETWYEYPKNHPDERIQVLKFVSPKIVELTEEVSEADRKGLFKRPETEMPDEVALKILDTYYENIGPLKKEYGEEKFNKLETEIKSYSIFMNQLLGDVPKKQIGIAKAMDRKPTLQKATLPGRLKQLKTKNQNLLSEYPKLNELMGNS